MKAAKVFIWIGMIFQFYLIFPIIVGVLALDKIKTANTQEELKTMGILTMFFCNLIGGILMLNISTYDLQNRKNYIYIYEEDIPQKNMKTKEDNSVSTLRMLYDLKQQGIITEEEFNEKKKKYLEQL